MNKLIILAICLAIANALPKNPEPCVSPPQWESRYFESNEHLKFFLRGYLSYDSINQRERIIDEVYLDHDKNFYDTIFLHKEQKQYKLNLKTRECVVGPLTRPWRDIGIPKDAKSLGESFIGSGEIPNAGLLTNLWVGEHKTENGTLKYMLQSTNTGCLPVTAAFFSEKIGATILHFSDIKPGIKDPHVFEPHKECLQNKNVKQSSEESSEESSEIY